MPEPAPLLRRVSQGVRRASLRPIAVGALAEVGLEDRFEHDLRRRLRYAIPHGRDAERALLARGLRYEPPQHRVRSVPAFAQLGLELFEEARHTSPFHGRERLSIDARRAAVRFDPPPCFPQDVTPVDAVIERMEAARSRLLGCLPEPLLESSHFVGGVGPAGVVGPRGPGHALALTSAFGLITAGALPSDRVVRRGHRRYYDPLGLPLRSARFRRRLMRGASP